MVKNQRLLSDLRDVEVDTIKKEKNFDSRTYLIELFKALYKLLGSKQDISRKDLANAAEKESERLGLESRYNWNEIFGLGKEVVQNMEKQNSTEQKSNGNLYPDNFYVGQAIGNGSCFFDSFRQGLEQQRRIKVTVQQLRNDCKKFAQNSPPKWFKDAITHSYDNNDQRRNETVDIYTKNIMNNNRWGDPEVEGRILCRKYGVKLHIIEGNPLRAVDNKQDPFLHQLIGSLGSKSVDNVDYNDQFTIHVVNGGRNHFEPLLDMNENLTKQTQENFLFAKQLQVEEDLLLAKKLQQEEGNLLYAKQLQEREDYLWAMKFQEQEDLLCAQQFQEQEYSYARTQTFQEQSDRLLVARPYQGQGSFSPRCSIEEIRVEVPCQQQILVRCIVQK